MIDILRDKNYDVIKDFLSIQMTIPRTQIGLNYMQLKKSSSYWTAYIAQEILSAWHFLSYAKPENMLFYLCLMPKYIKYKIVL